MVETPSNINSSVVTELGNNLQLNLAGFSGKLHCVAVMICSVRASSSTGRSP
jgi:hypothetical protein